MPTMIDENRYSSRAACLTIRLTIGSSEASRPRPTRVGQQLPREGLDELLRAPQDRRPQLARAVERRAVGQRVRRRRSAGRRPPWCASARSRRSSRARSRTDPSARGRTAQAGFARCFTSRSRIESPSLLAVSSRSGTFGGGGGGGALSRFSSIHFPRKDRRGARRVGRHREDAPVAEQPAAAIVGHRHAAEAIAVDRRGSRSAAPAAR